MTKIATVGDVIDEALAKHWEEGDLTGQLGTDKTNCPTYFELMALRLGGSFGKALTITGEYTNDQLVKNSDISVPDAITYIQKTINIYYNAPNNESLNPFDSPGNFTINYTNVNNSVISSPELGPSETGFESITVNVPDDIISGEHIIEISYNGAGTIFTGNNNVEVMGNADANVEDKGDNSWTITWYNWSEDGITIILSPQKDNN